MKEEKVRDITYFLSYLFHNSKPLRNHIGDGMCCVILLIILAFLCTFRGHHHENPRIRFGAYSVSLGMVGLSFCVIASNLPYSESTWIVMLICGCGAMIIGLAAIVFAIRAFRTNRTSLPGAPIQTTLGGMFGFLSFVSGTILLLAGSGVIHYLRGPEPVWQSDDFDLEVSLPTRDVQFQNRPSAVIELTGQSPSYRAIVSEIRESTGPEDFRNMLQKGKDFKNTLLKLNTHEDAGFNYYRRPIWFFICRTTINGSEAVYGLSVTQVGQLGVLLRFESPITSMLTREKESQEKELRSLAERFLGSARPRQTKNVKP